MSAIARATTGVIGAVLLLSGCGGEVPTAGPAEGQRVGGAPHESTPSATEPTEAGGSEPGGSPSTAAAPEATDASTGEPAVVPAELDFTAATVDGDSFDARTVAGQDALFYFWAPWCPICRREAPGLPSVLREYEGVRFVTVGGSSNDRDQMADFVADTGLDQAINLADVSGEVWTRFGVTYQYTYVFVDDSGSVETVTGPLEDDQLRSRLDALTAT